MKIARHSQRFVGMYSHFDPRLIIYQIVCMQIVFYGGQVFFFGLFDMSFGLRYNVGQFLHFSTFDTIQHTQYGYISLLSNVLNSAFVISGLVYVVVKANKVLDYVATIYFFHFIFCAFYSGLYEFQWLWLMVNAVILLFIVFAGEYVCIRLEQQEIKLLDTIFNSIGSKKKKKQYVEIQEILTL